MAKAETQTTIHILTSISSSQSSVSLTSVFGLRENTHAGQGRTCKVSTYMPPLNLTIEPKTFVTPVFTNDILIILKH